MPYKDKEKQKEAQRNLMRKSREPRDVNPDDVNLFIYEGSHNFMDYKNYEFFETEGKRYSSKDYMLLSDGQAHKRWDGTPDKIPDRVIISYKPECSLSREAFIQSMQACNRADQWRGKLDREKAHEVLKRVFYSQVDYG